MRVIAQEYDEYRKADTAIRHSMGWTGKQHTRSQPENNACLLHSIFDLKTMFDRCSHRRLAQNIVSLRGERND